MDAVIDGQADEDRHKRDRQNVQVMNGGGGKCEGISQSHQQAQRRFYWAASLLVSVDKNQSADQQRSDAGHRSVLLGLLHLVVFEHRFAEYPQMAWSIPHLVPILRYLTEQEITRHKLPERLAVVTSFPLSPVGKVSKKDLAAMVVNLEDR